MGLTTNDSAVCTSFLQYRVQHILGISDQVERERERERESGRERVGGGGSGCERGEQNSEQTTCEDKNV